MSKERFWFVQRQFDWTSERGAFLVGEPKVIAGPYSSDRIEMGLQLERSRYKTEGTIYVEVLEQGQDGYDWTEVRGQGCCESTGCGNAFQGDAHRFTDDLSRV